MKITATEKSKIDSFASVRAALLGDDYILRNDILDCWYIIKNFICDSIECYTTGEYVDKRMNKLIVTYGRKTYEVWDYLDDMKNISVSINNDEELKQKMDSVVKTLDEITILSSELSEL